MFRKLLDQGQAGDNCGSCSAVSRKRMWSVVRCSKPGSDPTREVQGSYGRRRVAVATPFFKGYRPQFYFRTTDVTGSIQLPDGVEMVMPGDNIAMTVTLITPIAMDKGPPLRDSRGWTHRRRRRGGRHHRVKRLEDYGGRCPGASRRFVSRVRKDYG